MSPESFRLDGTLERRAAALEATARALRAGELALLPAEGLYGLHACALRAEARARLSACKGGASDRPYILLIGTPAHALPFVSALPGPAAALLETAWPGPLTLLLPASERVAPELQREGRVALRCPGRAFLRELLLLLTEPLLSTSANRAGSPAPRSLETVDPEIRAACSVVVDRGTLNGEGSTVARPEADGRLTILREGAWRPDRR